MKKIIILFVCLALGACVDGRHYKVQEAEKLKHYVTEINKKMVGKKPEIEDIQGKIKASRKYKADIKIKDVALPDFIRVVMTEVFNKPYVMERGLEALNKRIDVEIRPDSNKNMYEIVLALIEKMGVECEEIDGVLLLTLRSGSEIKNNVSSVGGAGEQKNQATKNEVNGYSRGLAAVPADCVYVYQPQYSRAVDLKNTIKGVLGEGSIILNDEATNKLIFRTTKNERRSIVKLLRSLDKRQKQVSVDVTVAEVSLEGDLSWGLETFLKNNSLEVSVSGEKGNYTMSAAVFASDWLRAIMQIGEKVGLIKINSNPFLLIRDGSSSRIEVGNEYPIKKTEKTNSTETATVNDIEYRKTGIIVDLLPVVSGEDVHMKMTIELSEGKKNNLSSIDSPIILTRKIESSVILSDNQSIIIGGLISEKSDNSKTYIPLDKLSFPVSASNGKYRAELVVILNVSLIKENGEEDYIVKMAEKFKNHVVLKRGKK